MNNQHASVARNPAAPWARALATAANSWQQSGRSLVTKATNRRTYCVELPASVMRTARGFLLWLGLGAATLYSPAGWLLQDTGPLGGFFGMQALAVAILLFYVGDEIRKDAFGVQPRRWVFQAAQNYPGLTIAELSRMAGVSEPLARYHVRVLARAGHVAVERDASRRLRVFPMESNGVGTRCTLSADDRAALMLLRRPPVRCAALALVDESPRRIGDLADACGVTASTMSHHVHRMEEGGLVDVVRTGRERYVYLREPGQVRRLLEEHPTPRPVPVVRREPVAKPMAAPPVLASTLLQRRL